MKQGLPQIIKGVGFDFSWDVAKVWKLDVPVVEIDINKLTWHFDIPFYSNNGQRYSLKPKDVIDNPSQYPQEQTKMDRVGLNYPIDIMENKGRLLILDGLHRLMKIYTRGDKTVMVRIIPRDMIPDILK